jgi:hypothetical protein
MKLKLCRIDMGTLETRYNTLEEVEMFTNDDSIEVISVKMENLPGVKGFKTAYWSQIIIAVTYKNKV